MELDILELDDGTVLVIGDETVTFYRSLDEFWAEAEDEDEDHPTVTILRETGRPFERIAPMPAEQAAAQRWDTRSLDSTTMKLHPDTTGACSQAGGSRRNRRNRGDRPLTHLSPRPPPEPW